MPPENYAVMALLCLAGSGIFLASIRSSWALLAWCLCLPTAALAYGIGCVRSLVCCRGAAGRRRGVRSS